MDLKQAISLVLSLVLAGASALYALAAGTNYDDVPATAWYAGAINYVTEQGLMSGTGGGRFSPDAPMTRAMLAAILYRNEGQPPVVDIGAFSDVKDGWYARAVNWAAASGIVSGYGDGRFGVKDNITREDLAAILWRYAGRPAASSSQDFSDESSIASYASTAVDWARANGIISGKGNNRFDPRSNATRAEIATMIMNYAQYKEGEEPTPPTPPTPSGSNTLVVYFSASNNTERVANTIADELDADIFELIPVNPYTSADLNWTTPGSRVNREHEDESLRDIALVADTVENWEQYDNVIIGYPNWWADLPMPVYTFLEEYDFAGKTIIPFVTHGGSGFSNTVGAIAALQPGATVSENTLSIARGDVVNCEETVIDWTNSLGLD